MRKRIVKNAAKCLKCESVIQFVSTHDFVTCKCGNLSVDGGTDYLKRLFREEDSWIEMSETVDVNLS